MHGVRRFFPILLNILPTTSAVPSAEKHNEVLEALAVEFSPLGHFTLRQEETVQEIKREEIHCATHKIPG